MGSCCLGAFGIVIGVIGLRNYYADDGDNRRYKNNYVVSYQLKDLLCQFSLI
jgi:hypothetical protein